MKKIAGYARNVEVVFGREPCKQIDYTVAIKVVRFGIRPTDAGGPTIGVVKDEQSHSCGPWTVEGCSLFGDHVTELICRSQRLPVHCLPSQLFGGQRAFQNYLLFETIV